MSKDDSYSQPGDRSWMSRSYDSVQVVEDVYAVGIGDREIAWFRHEHDARKFKELCDEGSAGYEIIRKTKP